MKERAHVGHNKRPLENVSIFRYLKEFWNFVYLAPKVLTYIHYGTPAAAKLGTVQDVNVLRHGGRASSLAHLKACSPSIQQFVL